MAFAAMSMGLAAAVLAAAPAIAHTPRTSQSESNAPQTPATDPALAVDAPLGEPQIDDWTVEENLDLPPSGVTAQLAAWIVASDDNDGRPFMIVDKLAADVFVFEADGGLLAHAPVLLGSARGDDSAPGVGDMALSTIPQDERTTPAGRFAAQFGPSKGEGTVLWIDYADAISMHPVITTNPREHRLQRIRSALPEDHRISHGCINVPAKFYAVLLKAFGDGGVVYVLPDTKPVAEVFPAFAANAAATAGSQQDRCADPLLDLRDSAPDPDPSLMCPVGDR